MAITPDTNMRSATEIVVLNGRSSVPPSNNNEVRDPNVHPVDPRTVTSDNTSVANNTTSSSLEPSSTPASVQNIPPDATNSSSLVTAQDTSIKDLISKSLYGTVNIQSEFLQESMSPGSISQTIKRKSDKNLQTAIKNEYIPSPDHTGISVYAKSSFPGYNPGKSNKVTMINDAVLTGSNTQELAIDTTFLGDTSSVAQGKTVTTLVDYIQYSPKDALCWSWMYGKVGDPGTKNNVVETFMLHSTPDQLQVSVDPNIEFVKIRDGYDFHYVGFNSFTMNFSGQTRGFLGKFGYDGPHRHESFAHRNFRDFSLFYKWNGRFYTKELVGLKKGYLNKISPGKVTKIGNQDEKKEPIGMFLIRDIGFIRFYYGPLMFDGRFESFEFTEGENPYNYTFSFVFKAFKLTYREELKETRIPKVKDVPPEVIDVKPPNVKFPVMNASKVNFEQSLWCLDEEDKKALKDYVDDISSYLAEIKKYLDDVDIMEAAIQKNRQDWLTKKGKPGPNGNLLLPPGSEYPQTLGYGFGEEYTKLKEDSDKYRNSSIGIVFEGSTNADGLDADNIPLANNRGIAMKLAVDKYLQEAGLQNKVKTGFIAYGQDFLVDGKISSPADRRTDTAVYLLSSTGAIVDRIASSATSPTNPTKSFKYYLKDDPISQLKDAKDKKGLDGYTDDELNNIFKLPLFIQLYPKFKERVKNFALATERKCANAYNIMNGNNSVEVSQDNPSDTLDCSKLSGNIASSPLGDAFVKYSTQVDPMTGNTVYTSVNHENDPALKSNENTNSNARKIKTYTPHGP